MVHHEPGCLKAGSSCGGLDCRNDVTSSKPTSVGRDVAEALQSRVSAVVLGVKRDYIGVTNSFKSNITNCEYHVSSPSECMDCSTKNVIYLISCRKCGVQYVGKTCQTLRSRFNNHRARLKQMCDIFLYNHFNSDNQSIEDINIMPIEEVTVEPEDQMTLADNLSAREEFWYRELCSVYPYGLNDNVYKVGNSLVCGDMV